MGCEEGVLPLLPIDYFPLPLSKRKGVHPEGFSLKGYRGMG